MGLPSRNVRSAAVSGTFYPADKQILESVVNNFIAEDKNENIKGFDKVAKALIVPHAGFQYSGSVAAKGYCQLQKSRISITKVILLGPAHRVAVNGMATSSKHYFSTPIGDVPVDTEAVHRLVNQFEFMNVNDQAHELEHSIETQLPFLQTVLDEFTLVPIVVGNAIPSQIAQCLQFLWGGSETLILISSDLSHFLDYESARVMDSGTTQNILDLNPQGIQYEHACGQCGIRGLIELAQTRPMQVELLDLGNSGDTSGDKNRVVGYGCFAFYEQPRRFSDADRVAMNDIARNSIDTGLEAGIPLDVQLENFDEKLRQSTQTFVTLLDQYDQLRGCIGTLFEGEPLALSISNNAFKAAFNDPRFSPLTRQEFENVTIKISVLSAPQRMEFQSEQEAIDQFRPYVDGIVFRCEGKRSTFLPAVWEKLPDRKQFLDNLKIKAGYDADFWSKNVELLRYTSESW